MTNEQRPSERITEVVTSWPGVTAGPGSRGELSFKVGRREIGHLHGDEAAHFGFPKEVWHSLFEEGRIEHHPFSPGELVSALAGSRLRKTSRTSSRLCT
jgi:hypothetical protein